jgi:NAD(P)-dependent dehydrogenase (short-subunit alcohol dehydrogenase family)
MSTSLSRLQGKVVVITAASSGIGRAAALEFARAGCRLVLAARRVAALEDTAVACRGHGGTATAVATDVTIDTDVSSAVFAGFGLIRPRAGRGRPRG